MDIGLRIKKRRLEKGLSQDEVAEKINTTKQTIYKYETGIITNIPASKIESLANVLDTTPAYLMGWTDSTDFDISSIPGINPLPKMVKKPRLGTIACGEPILAVENIEDYDDVPDDIKCDFTLICKGDSMINARINDGDIVYIRKQEQVDNGEIAAVLIDNEATLKRVYVYSNKVVLQPENPKYEPFVYVGEEMNEIRIIGKAVGFTSML